MDEKSFKVSYLQVAKKTSVAVITGALMTPLFILVPGFLQVLKSGDEYYGLDYAGGFFIVACGLQLVYQLPIYLTSNLLFVRLFNGGRLKSMTFVYFLAGILGWISNAGLLFVIDTKHDIQTIQEILEFSVPVLIIYYLICLFPEMLKKH